MSWDEIKNLQLEDVMAWSARAKAIAALVLVVIIGAIAWFYFIEPEQTHYDELHQQVLNLKSEVRQKQLLAAALPAYQAQIHEMNQRFQEFLLQLPNRAQIPSLLDDVTLAGRSRGLDFQLFQPLPEVDKNFYAEIPVKIQVVGTYADIGRFAAAVAAMPRIVTIGGIQITRVPGPTGSALAKAAATQELNLSCVATTYRYLDGADQHRGGGAG